MICSVMFLYEKHRLKRLIVFLCLMIFIGIQYMLIWQLSGIGFPCVFYKLSGLHCPGCGISRMLISLLRFDLYAAFQYNAGILTALPALAVLFIQICIHYVKKGNLLLSKKQEFLAIAIVIWLLLFWILRNIPSFSFLSLK